MGRRPARHPAGGFSGFTRFFKNNYLCLSAACFQLTATSIQQQAT